MIRRLQANVRVAAAQIEERGPGYSRSAASSYSRSRSERPRQRRRSQGPLDPVAKEGRGENEVAHPVNPAAIAAANNPIQATELRIMHDQELLRRAQYDQDNGPPDDIYVIPVAHAPSASPRAVNNFPALS
jgi:hypothetical protein